MTQVQKVARVPQPVAVAFDLFTHRIAEWWPLETHSVGLDQTLGVVVEPGAGGRILESITAGRIEVWGTVLDWQPPTHVRFSWHPGRPDAEATEIDVRFRETQAGSEVALTHGGWDRRPDGAEARQDYDSGWDFVFGRYAEAAGGTLES